MAKMREIDPRWVFLCVAAALIVTLKFPFSQRFTPSPTVQSIYDFIEELPEGSAVLIGADYDPQARAEVVPITKALLKHCFKRNLRVIGLTFWSEGATLHNRVFEEVAAAYGRRRAVDYVYLGYQAGGFAQILTALGDSFTETFRTEYNGEQTASMPIFQDIRSLRDVSYMIDIEAGLYVGSWIAFGSDKYGIPMAAGGTAILGPDLYVYLSTGQLNGVIAGLRGAADYETLLEEPDMGVSGMAAQSTVHAIIVLFVIAANIVYFRRRRAQRSSGNTQHE